MGLPCLLEITQPIEQPVDVLVLGPDLHDRHRTGEDLAATVFAVTVLTLEPREPNEMPDLPFIENGLDLFPELRMKDNLYQMHAIATYRSVAKVR